MKPKNFNVILVPTDFSDAADNALAQAVIFAMNTNSKLVVIHTDEMDILKLPFKLNSLGLILDHFKGGPKKKLKRIVKKIKEENSVNIEYASYNGGFHENIIRSMQQFNADLIVMGIKSVTGMSEWLYRSNVLEIVKNSSIPILTIQLNSGEQGFKRIMFPFNSNPVTIIKLDQVIEFIKAFNATVLLFGFCNSVNVAEYNAIRDKGNELALKLAKDNIKYTFSIEKGNDYEKEILIYARKECPDLISIVRIKAPSSDFKHPVHSGIVVKHSEFPVLSVPVFADYPYID